jgi:hypothetical protein
MVREQSKSISVLCMVVMGYDNSPLTSSPLWNGVGHSPTHCASGTTLVVMVSLTVDGKSQPECRLAQQGIREKEITEGAKKGAQEAGNPRRKGESHISTTTGK